MSKVTTQEYATRTVRTAAILTNAYVAGTVLGVATNDANQLKLNDTPYEWNHLALEIQFTIGSLTDGRIKIEVSDDNVTFYQTIIGSVVPASGTNTLMPMEFVLTATGNYYVSINSENLTGSGLKARFIRVSAKGTGTVTSSSMAITAIVGVN